MHEATHEFEKKKGAISLRKRVKNLSRVLVSKTKRWLKR